MSSQFFAPAKILTIWKQFDHFPMETLTKAWVLKNRPELGQRDISEMKAHRAKTGASGNCFDLALWLWHEFEQTDISAYAIADSLGTLDAHVALIALDNTGQRFLCDLGDLWIQPIAIDSSSEELQDGFFTGARVKVLNQNNRLKVEYHRANKKISHQSYDLSPVSKSELIQAGEFSQRNLSSPLVEMRIKENDETIHWEFDQYKSYFSRLAGLEKEEPCVSDEAWAKRIANRTGMNASYVLECLIELRKQL